MKNFMSADLHRIMTKKIRVLLVALLAIIEVISVLKGISGDKNTIEMTLEVGGLDIGYTCVIMLINIFIAYGDDIRAKSMQAALGMGLKRHQLVVAKWFDLSAVIILDMLFLTIVQFIPLIVAGKLAGSFVVGQVIVNQISVTLAMILSMTLTMIILFQTQKAILGVLMYAYITFQISSSILSLAVSNKFVQRFQLWDIGAENQLSMFISKLWIGQFDIKNFLMVVLYFVIGFGVTIYLFRRKELDF